MTSDFNYKKYSLEHLENWMHDAMSSDEATPQEIYNVIIGVVKENYYHYKHHASKAHELLALLNGDKLQYTATGEIFACDNDDPSPECKGAWNSFWEENYYPEESNQYTEGELNAMCDKAELDAELEQIRKEGGFEWTPDVKKKEKTLNHQEAVAAGWTMTDDGFWMPPQEKKKWILPVEECKDADTDKTEYFVSFPDDLLEAADLKEGDEVEWIDNGNGTYSYTLKKVTKPLGPDEC